VVGQGFDHSVLLLRWSDHSILVIRWNWPLIFETILFHICDKLVWGESKRRKQDFIYLNWKNEWYKETPTFSVLPVYIPFTPLIFNWVH